MAIKLDLAKIRIQVISDIHLELRKSPPVINVSAEILALCGDIGGPKQESYRSLLAWASTNYAWVFIIAGNHEFYHNHDTIEELTTHIEEVVSGFPNITFLNNSTVELQTNNDTVRVFGSTLWSDTSKHAENVKRVMNDYVKIKRKNNGRRTSIVPEDTIRLHKIAVAALRAEINTDGPPLIVLTHHLPSLKLIHDDFTDASINCAYASDLDELISPPVVLWMHGHSHRAADTRLNKVRIVCNPMGYPGENTKKYREYICVDVSYEITRMYKHRP